MSRTMAQRSCALALMTVIARHAIAAQGGVSVVALPAATTKTATTLGSVLSR